MSLKIASEKLNGVLLNHFTQVESSGFLKTDTVISGPYSDLRINIDNEAEPLSIAGFKADQFTMDGQYRVSKTSLASTALI